MRSFRFYSAFTWILISASVLSFRAFSIILVEPSLQPSFFGYCFSFFNSFLCVGIGAALPFVLIASMLGWGQLALLIQGNINPHLSREGFVNTLGILLSKL
jgi:hypothetical protein